MKNSARAHLAVCDEYMTRCAVDKRSSLDYVSCRGGTSIWIHKNFLFIVMLFHFFMCFSTCKIDGCRWDGACLTSFVQQSSKQLPGKTMTDRPGNTATYLLAKQTSQLPDIHRVKVVIVGAGHVGISIAIAILFKRLASELVLIDPNEEIARAEAEDISHAGAFLGNPRIVGTKDYSAARDAAVCVITAGGKQRDHQEIGEILDNNVDVFRSIIPAVCKFAPNCVLIIVTPPVDILSYASLKLSGFPPNRVIGIGTYLDTCRFQYYIAEKLGISPTSVQALVIGENSSTSVPVWSAVSVMGMQLKDINREIGSRTDPEGWSEIHNKVVASEEELIRKKGSGSRWALGICVVEVIDAIVRNTAVCMTVSTFIKGCKHGLEKDIFMSLPCIIGRNGVQSYIRHLYTQEEQEMTTNSCREIYDLQKSIMSKLE